MAKKPDQYSTLTSALFVDNAKETIELYKKALGAEVCGVMNCPSSGKIIHAGLKIGESTLFISDANEQMGMPATGRQQFYVYVEDADSAFEKAKAAGFKAVEAPQDMFWGDRVGALTDANGNTWKLGHHVRDVPPEEMMQAIKQMAEAN